MNSKTIMQKFFGLISAFMMFVLLYLSMEIAEHILVLIVANDPFRCLFWVIVLIIAATYGIFLGVIGAILLLGKSIEKI